jgi:single-strand DNA-binding protein
MSGLNLWVGVGRLTADPELKYTAKGIAYLNFVLAIEKTSTKGKHTDFIRMTAWRGVAEGVASFAKKGMMFMVEGDLSSKSYPINGKKITQLNLSVKTATVIGGKKVTDGEDGDEAPWPEDEELSDDVNP